MSETATTEATADEISEVVDTEPTRSADPTEVEFEKGTWQFEMKEAAKLYKRSDAAKKKAGTRLWDGAQDAITEWVENSADDDKQAEQFANDLLDIMGTSRKGDVSKIKTVALAVKGHDLALSQFDSLSKAYAEARRLTQTLAAEAAEDDAAETAIEALINSEDTPSTASTPENAAYVLFSKGMDGATVAILNALDGPGGVPNPDAHRAFARNLMTEITSRIQAAKDAEAAEKAKAAAEAKAKRDAEKAAADAEKAAKAEAAPAKKAASKAKAKPVAESKSKGDPNKKALPPRKAAPAKSAKPKPVVKAG